MKHLQEEYRIFCNWCGKWTRLIWIHGHGQCARCGTNIDECCQGEKINNKPEVTS